MGFPRRKYLVGVGTGVMSSLSGCVIGGDGESNDNSEPEEPVDNTSTPKQEEESPPPELYYNFKNIFDFTKWLNTDQHTARSEYVIKINQAKKTAKELENKTVEDITTDDVQRLSDDIREIASITSVFDEYYADHIAYGTIADRVKQTYNTHIQRREYDKLRNKIENMRRQLEAFASSSEVVQRYPRDIIYGNPYRLFSENPSDERGNKIFELNYYSQKHSDAFWSAPGRMNFVHHPIGKNLGGKGYQVPKSAVIDTDYAQSPTPRKKRQENIYSIADHLSVDNNRKGEIYMIITDYYTYNPDYPEVYTFGLNEEKAPDRADLLSPILINKPPQMDVYMQLFSNTQAAKDALNTLSQKWTKSGTANLETFNTEKYYYNTNGETFYVDLLQLENILVAFDLSAQTWDGRWRNEIIYDRDIYKNARVAFVDDTFFNPESVLSKNQLK